MVKTTVLTDASASITCKMSGYNSATAPTDIWYDYSGAAYNSSTTTAGNVVTKVTINIGRTFVTIMAHLYNSPTPQ